MKSALILAAFVFSLVSYPCGAQSGPVAGVDPSPIASSPDGTATISSTEAANQDSDIASRLQGIYRELDGLEPIQVAVDSGVVVLSGSLVQSGDIDRARQIALRVDGVVAVQNNLKKSGDVSETLSPVMARLKERLDQIVKFLPLLAIALIIMVLFWLLGSALARARSFWNRISPNSFLADLLATTARLLVIVTGLVIALDLLGATTLLGAILGSAGVVGLAIGFAVKDTVDNYVSSIMLSIRQPFRAHDHVVIGDREGLVIRLTSRATILMTLEGNHLRIPNSTVFMSEILNYTRNSERRFEFTLGIDAEDDPGEAMRVGIDRLSELPFLLRDPAPSARLDEVGDSNIILKFLGWIDQTETDWFKARSAAIRAVKMALEAQGFGLPEPTYRLRFDHGHPLEIARSGAPALRKKFKGEDKATMAVDHQDVAAETNIEKKVTEERERSVEEDMLDRRRPIE
ncbi:mechanosensitive ion channel [Altererythrobacter aerius]|uniref:Small-conductance mechanosensitive channel n=1 Tax=Tsuneonella aeria TaxID=1837929 RepID=A0A6I4TBW0_9SPHN|nr:mechanosensitive ion channel family protein [Tsuneonella aeria]MXO75019.1 mechanosensitive ion channel [Tsuneonella aeria]